MGLTSFINNV